MAEQYINLQTGKLMVGEVAVQCCLEEGVSDIAPLADFLTQPNPSFETMDIKVSRQARWPYEQVESYGLWLAEVVAAKDDTLRLEHIFRMSKLNLGPSEKSLFKWAGVVGLEEFKDKIGLNDGRGDYEARRGWEAGNYVDWGVQFMKANDGLVLTPNLMRRMSASNRGPSLRVIRDHFGYWSDFKKQVMQQYEAAQLRKIDKLNRYQEWMSKGILPVGLAEAPENKLLQAGGAVALVEAFMPGISEEVTEGIFRGRRNSIVKYIRSRRPEISQADIEIVAVRDDLFDDIWPPQPDPITQLRLDDHRSASGQCQPKYFKPGIGVAA